jgi:hypothetical protein
LLAIRTSGTKGSPGPGGPVDTTIADDDPPPLCLAICQLAWRVRDPDLVAALATTLLVLSQQPALQGLGAALMNEAPDAFSVLVTLLAQTQPKTPTAAPSGGANASQSPA